MFGFNKRKKDEVNQIASHEEEEKRDNAAKKIGTSQAIMQEVQQAKGQAAIKYAKPGTYTGNRALYDSEAAKKNAKKKLFETGKKVIDPYTGDKLVLTEQEARLLYGENWVRHLAESDHVRPLERIYNETKGNVWNTTDEIRAAANSDDNIRVVSKKFNSSKSNRTNEEYYEYLAEKGVEVSEQGKQRAINDSEFAEQSINKQLKEQATANRRKTGHEAGKASAKSAGITTLTMSGIMNIVAVIKGEKEGEEAVKDTVKDSAKATVTGYAVGRGMTVVSHSLSGSSSKFLKGLANSNVPGKVITAVTVTGDTLKKWGKGEITTQQCLIELGDKGLNLATAGYSMAIGQAVIPIPIVGAAVGALVGSMLTSEYYNQLIVSLQTRELEHQERLRIIAECNAAAEQAKAFRKELEVYLESYFKEYRDCFDSALSSMRFSYETGDADGVIASANEITRKLGGQVHYETVEEFKSFLDDDSTDIL